MVDSVVRNTPRSGGLGTVADILKAANEALTIKSPGYKKGDFQLPIGEFLGIGALGRVADNASYGDSPFVEARGVDRSFLPTVKNGRGDDLRDVALGAAGLSPLAARGAKAGAMGAAKAVDNAMMTGEGPLSKVLGASKPAFAIKPKGGNWNDKALDSDIEDFTWGADVEGPATQWANKNLRNYVKNQMGTVDDPLAKLQGDELHIPPNELMNNVARSRPFKPEEDEFHFNATGRTLRNPMEILTDQAIATGGTIGRAVKNRDLDGREVPEWMRKADPETPMYTTTAKLGSLQLDRLVGEVRDSGLPFERIKNMSVADVAKAVGAKRVAKEKELEKLRSESGYDEYKAYPEKGHRWVKLNKASQFSKESDEMGHSVRGYERPDLDDAGSEMYGHGGWKAIQEGKAEVFSLRGPDGKPRTTVEIRRKDPAPERYQDQVRHTMNMLEEVSFNIVNQGNLSNTRRVNDIMRNERAIIEEMRYGSPSLEEMKYLQEKLREIDDEAVTRYMDENPWPEFVAKEKAEPKYAVTQIKGKFNEHPDPETHDMIEDFLNSRKWDDGEVGDLYTLDIYDMNNMRRHFTSDPAFMQKAKEKFGDKRFIKHDDVDQLYAEHMTGVNAERAKKNMAFSNPAQSQYHDPLAVDPDEDILGDLIREFGEDAFVPEPPAGVRARLEEQEMNNNVDPYAFFADVHPRMRNPDAPNQETVTRWLQDNREVVANHFVDDIDMMIDAHGTFYDRHEFAARKIFDNRYDPDDPSWFIGADDMPSRR